jgi:Trk K+ transport system NAD-binding subunit
VSAAQSQPGGRAVLVLGEPRGLSVALVRRLRQDGVCAEAAASLSDSETAAVLHEARWGAVAVVTREDVLALRLTLLSAHVRPDLPLWVTMFDRTIARELSHVAPAVHVLSPTEIAAVDMAEQCIAAAGPRASQRRHGVRLVDDALRLLVRAGLALLLVLLFEAAIAMVALDEGLVDALYFSTRSVATVASAPHAASGPAWFKILSALDTLAALLLVAVFTAALVRRLSRSRLTTVLGRRAAPARHHVLLVGFGQIGFRLAQELRRRGVAVLAVERDTEAPCIRLARAAGIPVAVGRGDDRETLERVGIRRCAAVAAVTSSDLVNVEVGLAASDLAPGTPIVLRLGDGEVAAETDSLLHLGRISDPYRIAAETLARDLGQVLSARASGSAGIGSSP